MNSDLEAGESNVGVPILAQVRFSGRIVLILACLQFGCRPSSSTEPDPINKIVFSVSTGASSSVEKNLPWEFEIQPPSTWTLRFPQAYGIKELHETGRIREISRVLSILEKHRVFEIPEGNFGSGDFVDLTVWRIHIETAAKSSTYAVGWLGSVKEREPQKLEYAIRLLEAWCEIEKELALPPCAATTWPQFRKMVERYRKEYESTER